MLVTLEGLDGSGKTTLWERLRDGTTLPEDAVFTREPTDAWYGEAVERSLADDDADPMAECFLYMADHAAHLAETVEPALAADRVVVSDRYADSRYAYQGVTLDGVVPDPLAYVQSLHEPWSRVPDLTIYLDVAPETAVERSAAANKFEREAHLASVRENYDRLRAAEPERFVVVDADQPPDAVHAAVSEVLASRLADGSD